jgi:DNA gyrase B/Histidine kinase-, DNA gyrase B-, and HSP90-like ATPase
MAWFEDLHSCTPFETDWKRPIAVGWLAKGHEFSRGPRDAAFAHRLSRFARRVASSGIVQHRNGFDRCELCDSMRAPFNHSALIIPGGAGVFVAPNVISHCILKHDYAPPQQFVDAANAAFSLPHAAYVAELKRHTATKFPREFVTEPLVSLNSTPVRGATGSSAEYNAANVVIPRGLDAVRWRPGMFVGWLDHRGLERLLFELVGNSFDQCLAGHATEIRVAVGDDGWTTVEDDGLGIPVETVGGQPALETIFTVMHSGATLDGHHPHVHLQDVSGVGLAPVNALCSRLEVETHRAGVSYRAVFAAGRVVEPVTTLGPSTARGTRIRYLADSQLFNAGVTLDHGRLEWRLTQLARLAPQVKFFFQGRPFQRGEGLSGLVRTLATDLVQETMLSAHGTIEGVDVDVAFGWSPTASLRVESFVNYLETPESGTHADGLMDAIREATPTRMDGTRALAGLVAVVHVGLLDPRFGGTGCTKR